MSGRRQDLLAAVAALARKGDPRRPTIIYPPTVHWDQPLVQRPHHLARAWARLGARVFFCPIEGRREAPSGLREISPGLHLCAEVAALRALPAPVLYLTWAHHAALAERFPAGRLLYDVIDELSLFGGYGLAMRLRHEELLEEADLVVASADQLAAGIAPARPDVLLAPNGVDPEHFAPALLPGPPPAELAEAVAAGRPIVGYTGALNAWFDHSQLRQVAALRPGFDFVCIGMDYDGTLGRQPAFPANVRFLGPRPYSALPGYLRHFAAATIPFVVDRETRAVSPLKLFEYLAAGLVPVCSDLPECRKVPEALLAGNAEEFARALDLAVSRRADPGSRARLAARAREHSWEACARQILARLEQAPARPRERQAARARRRAALRAEHLAREVGPPRGALVLLGTRSEGAERVLRGAGQVLPPTPGAPPRLVVLHDALEWLGAEERRELLARARGHGAALLASVTNFGSLRTLIRIGTGELELADLLRPGLPRLDLDPFSLSREMGAAWRADPPLVLVEDARPDALEELRAEAAYVRHLFRSRRDFPGIPDHLAGFAAAQRAAGRRPTRAQALELLARFRAERWIFRDA